MIICHGAILTFLLCVLHVYELTFMLRGEGYGGEKVVKPVTTVQDWVWTFVWRSQDNFQPCAKVTRQWGISRRLIWKYKSILLTFRPDIKSLCLCVAVIDLVKLLHCTKLSFWNEITPYFDCVIYIGWLAIFFKMVWRSDQVVCFFRHNLNDVLSPGVYFYKPIRATFLC